jgi:hypothetical protein
LVGRRDVADAENADHVPDDAVTDDVGIRCHQLPAIGAGDNSAAVRKVREAAAGLEQSIRQFLRRPRIELRDTRYGIKVRMKRR